MAEPEESIENPPGKASKIPMMLALVLALAGGGGGFYAVYSGVILGGTSQGKPSADMTGPQPLADIVFVAVEPLIVSLTGNNGTQHLRFRAQLEVNKPYVADVETLLPRVVDVLNGYLRALRTSDLEGQAALIRLRAQMLRRVQIVTGKGRVNDLLIMEFVLN